MLEFRFLSLNFDLCLDFIWFYCLFPFFFQNKLNAISMCNMKVYVKFLWAHNFSCVCFYNFDFPKIKIKRKMEKFQWSVNDVYSGRSIELNWIAVHDMRNMVKSVLVLFKCYSRLCYWESQRYTVTHTRTPYHRRLSVLPPAPRWCMHLQRSFHKHTQAINKK